VVIEGLGCKLLGQVWLANKLSGKVWLINIRQSLLVDLQYGLCLMYGSPADCLWLRTWSQVFTWCSPQVADTWRDVVCLCANVHSVPINRLAV